MSLDRAALLFLRSVDRTAAMSCWVKERCPPGRLDGSISPQLHIQPGKKEAAVRKPMDAKRPAAAFFPAWPWPAGL